MQATSWKGFLPRRSIVMARKGPAPQLNLGQSVPAPSTLPQEPLPAIFGEGSPTARLMFIGKREEPSQGSKEEEAGKLLDRMLEAIHLKRENVYLVEVIQARLTHPEMFHQWIEKLQPTPQVIVTLGEFATQLLLNSKETLSSLRGNFHPYQAFKVMPTFDLATLLENPATKKDTWKDLQKVAQTLGIQLLKRKT